MDKSKLVIACCFVLFCNYASAVNPISIVYRADDRNIDEIRQAGGMFPWNDGQPDDDLAHHFEGESVEGGTSNFVSTSASLRSVVMHAASLARPNSRAPFDVEYVTYIYMVRPMDTFYSVDEALTAARNASTNPARRNRISTLINDYAGMEEFAARGGFNHNRIISYARLTGQMLTDNYDSGSLFLSSYWSNRWINNVDYNVAFNNNVTSVDTYADVDTPRGLMLEVQNDDQEPVPLRFTCMGAGPQQSESRVVESINTCSTHQFLNIKRKIYDVGLLVRMLE